MRSRASWFVIVVAATACDAVLGVPDLTYESAPPAHSSSATGGTANGAGASSIDGGAGQKIATSGNGGLAVTGGTSGHIGEGGASASGGTAGANGGDAGTSGASGIAGAGGTGGSGGALGGVITCDDVPVDSSSDPKNCGVCGHDCRGATCTHAMCDAFILLGPANVTESITLAIDPSPAGLVYLADYYGHYVSQIDKSGNGLAVDLSTDPFLPPNITMDASFLYVPIYEPNVFMGHVERVSRANPKDAVSMTGDYPANPWCVALDDTYLYTGIRFGGGAILRTPLASPGGVEHLLDKADDEMLYLFVDDQRVYWQSYATGIIAMRSLPKAGGDASDITTYATTPGSLSMTVDSGYVYWEESAKIVRQVADKSLPAEVVEQGLAGYGFLVDGDWLYFLTATHPDMPGRLYRVPKDGSAAPTLVLDGLTNAYATGMDPSCIYVTEDAPDAAIVRVAKPL